MKKLLIIAFGPCLLLCGCSTICPDKAEVNPMANTAHFTTPPLSEQNLANQERALKEYDRYPRAK